MELAEISHTACCLIGAHYRMSTRVWISMVWSERAAAGGLGLAESG